MSWEEVEVSCGFGGGEETTRFGPRQETGSSLYQVDTVACINSKTEIRGSPWLLSSGCMQKMALVIQKTVLVFDESCSEHQCSFKAESLVDAVAWSDDGSFLVYADRTGCLHLAHLESQQVLFSKQIIPLHEVNRKPCFVSATFLKEKNDLYELVVLSRDGQGFRFTSLDLNGLKQAISNRDLESVSQIQSNIKMAMFSVNDCHEITNMASFYGENDENYTLVAGNGDFGMSEWCLSSDNEVYIKNFGQHLSPNIGFKKVLETTNEQYIVALDEEHHISIWSRQSFCFLQSWTDALVEDFIFFITSSVETDQSKNSKSKEELKVVILTKPQKMKRKLIVLSLPTFEHVYTVQVSCSAALAALPNQQEIIMFIEGVEEENLDDSMEETEKIGFNVATVRVRCLMEAIPQNRFSRLLHKKKFEEAEQFAKMFGLDVQLVHKVKSHHVLDELSPWGTDKHDKEIDYEHLMIELKNCLNKVEDMEHVVNCCLQAQLPTLVATSDLLNYAREKVNFEARKFTKSSDLFQALLDGINRLVTFEVAFGANRFTGSEWSSFLSSSLVDEVIKCFEVRNISSGIIIWRRHQSEFESQFTYQKLEKLLNSIPKSTPSSKIIPWLRLDFVPFVLTILPEGQGILADWLETTARGLELFEKEQWPGNALELAEVMYTAFSSVSQSTQNRGIATPKQFATKICKLSIPFFDDTADGNMSVIGLSSAMKKLGNLVKSLREVKSLHQEYNCKLSLNQFCSEDTRTITYRLLNRIAAAELIPQTIKKYVKPYVYKNNLKLDQLLYEYIVVLVDSNNQVASLWEPKVIAIINEIEKKEPRCDATMKLMLKARTPWSSEVESLVSSQIKLNPENEKLQRQFQFAKLRKMMAGYGIRETNLADMSRIEAVIKYMFSTDNKDSLEDALQICQHFPAVTTAYVYFLRIKFWIASNKISESSELLRRIAAQDAVKVSELCLVWVDNIISWQPLDEEDMLEQIQITEAVFVIVNIVSRLDKQYKCDTITVRNNLQCISGLQKEFGAFLSLTNYVDEEHRKKLIKQYVKNPDKKSIVMAGMKKFKKNIDGSRLIRFSELLGRSGAELDGLLFEVYKENHQLDDIVKLARNATHANDDDLTSIQCSPAHNRLLCKIVHFLMTTNADYSKFNWVQSADLLHHISSQAVSFCHDNDITDSLLLSRLMRLCLYIASQCESTDYQDDPKKIDGLLHQWIDEQYKDDSLVLSSQDVFPILKNLISYCIKAPESALYRYESFRLSGKSVSCTVTANEDKSTSITAHTLEFSKVAQLLVNMLHENNQQELAVQILMLGISTCAQHSANLQMGVPIEIADENYTESANQLVQHELKTAQMVLSKGDHVVKEYCTSLVRSILGHRVVDHDLALCYLDVFPTKEGNTLLHQIKTKFGNKYTRIQVIAKVGSDFASLRYNLAFKKKFRELKECAYWGRKLQLLRIPPPWNIYSVIEDKDERRKILNILVQHKGIDVDAIVGYCKSFLFDEEKAILMYIECQLFPPDRVIISTDTSYQEKVDQCINMYTSRLPNNCSSLETLLNSTIKKISPYDYERLTYIFKKIAEISENPDITRCAEENRTLLDMLSRYERTATEVDYSVEYSMMADDMEEEQILNGKSAVIPELAKKRLPFHPIAKTGVTWQVLNPEMTSEKNVILLKPIVSKLKFDTDQMFAKAVQNIAGKEFKKQTKDGKPATFEFSLVENILNMIENDTIMMAAAKWLAKYLPRGIEKAKVLKAIADRLQNLVNKSTGEVQAQAMQTFKRFNDVYKRVSVEAALIEYGISDEKFFTLCSSPAKLIIELFEEYGDKVRFETGKMTGAPEIHSLAEIIARISGDVDLERVIPYLVKKWLPSIRSSAGNSDDEDIDMMVSSSEDVIEKENEKNLRRVIYVFASSYNHKTIKVLLNSVFQETNDQTLSNVCKIRALQVLFTLVDTQTIEHEANLSVANIHEKLLSCIYLSDLESLHISHSEEAFKKSNKGSLVKGLWRNHSHEPQGIRLIADICLDYKIYDPQLWNSLLLKLLSFDMIPYLTHVLVLLSGIPQLREIPSLTKMWRAIVTAPFISVSCPLSQEEEEACMQASQLLTRCPVILDMGLPEIALLMKKAGLYIHCMFCMKLIPDRKLRRDSIQALLDDVGIDVILSKIKKSRDQGIMDAHLDQIEEVVFDYVNEHNLFVSLHGTTYFDSLVGYLIRSNKINKLLMRTITAGRITNALELMEMHLSVHSTSEFSLTVLNNGWDTRHALLVYLQRESLLSDAKQYMSSILGTDTSKNDIEMTCEYTQDSNTFDFLNGHS